jgi:DNA-binding LytR/AlgR family response regulator
MIKLAICDDDVHSIKRTSDIVAEVANNIRRTIEIDTYSNAGDILHRLLQKKESLDILVLDIDMPEMTGLELAERLRSGGENLIIIFLTAHDSYVYKAIEYTPFRYVRKGCAKTELPIALKAAVQLIESQSDSSIVLRTEDGDERVSLSEILFYELDLRRKIIVQLHNGKSIVTTRMTIKDMQTQISESRFIPLHRSMVVNASHVRSIKDAVVTLNSGEKLIVSRPQVKEVKKKLMHFWGEMT